jgi:hypothetical protein
MPDALRLIERALAATDPTQATNFEGQGRLQINEAQVRQYIIDPMLEALGWKLNDPAYMVIEAGVDPSTGKQHRRFLDYLGVGRRDECQASLLVEAKRLSHALPAHEQGMDLARVMTDALKEAKKAKESPDGKKKRSLLSVEWLDVLTTLFDYVQRLNSSRHGAPRKVLLTNGDWLVVFVDPGKTLVHHDFAVNDLLVVSDLEQAGKNAAALFAHLAYKSFTDGLLEQNAFDLCRFVVPDGDPLPASFAVEISTAQLGSRPLLGVLPAVAVQMPGGGWVRFKNPAVEQRVLVWDSQLPEEMAAVRGHAEQLVAELKAQRDLSFVAAIEFEETIPKDPPLPSSRLLRQDAADSFIMYLGTETHPFVDPGGFAGCPYHFYGEAFKEGVAAEPPIYKRSTEPPAYFPSGTAQHCAHGGVHARRAKRCAIRAMDEFLCCKACALQARCWPDEAPTFPCKRKSQVVDVREPPEQFTRSPPSKAESLPAQ